MEIYRLWNDPVNMIAKLKQGKKTLKIILDSNALFVPFQFKIDIFEELGKLLNMKFDLVVLSPIRKELEAIAEKGSPKMRKWASCALKLAERCSVLDIEENSAESPDDIIIKAAKMWNYPVFTNDKELRRRLRDISVPVIYVRKKSRLEFDGRITPSV